MEALKMATNTTPAFSLKGVECTCKVVSIHDGDTVNLVFLFNNSLVKFACRLADIDTPELHPKTDDLEKKQLEIMAAKLARNRLIKLCTNIDVTGDPTPSELDKQLTNNTKLVYAKFGAFEKYGRLLVELYETKGSAVSFNQILVGEQLAKAYNGGKKEVWF